MPCIHRLRSPHHGNWFPYCSRVIALMFTSNTHIMSFSLDQWMCYLQRRCQRIRSRSICPCTCPLFVGWQCRLLQFCPLRLLLHLLQKLHIFTSGF
uniref:Uncharacterized protein MANES_01G176500 n=1 Tax=Rhizophora mucronata TaxID=61149 RepID=A0A2P2PMC2_RHIMU